MLPLPEYLLAPASRLKQGQVDLLARIVLITVETVEVLAAWQSGSNPGTDAREKRKKSLGSPHRVMNVQVYFKRSGCEAPEAIKINAGRLIALRNGTSRECGERMETGGLGSSEDDLEGERGWEGRLQVK